ncbi:MAG: phosphoribosyltransferase family protein [Lachnospiraceae bacterium]|nr:phosphoribosyltransferase family protein [Lachnospiraceae bacterium]
MREYSIEDLVCVAKRENNSKRAYLYVNPIQGKHIPVSPNKPLELYKTMAKKLEERFPNERLLIIGFAETATAIGAAIASYADNVTFCTQTTREKYQGARYLYFTESHSHATEQSLIISGYEYILDDVDRIVFAEDEVTTGNTIIKLISAIRTEYEGKYLKFGIISILNSMSDYRIFELEKDGIPCLYINKIPYEYNIENIDSFKYLEFESVKASPYNEKIITGIIPPNLRYVQDKSTYSDSVNAYIKKVCEKVHISKDIKRILVLGTEEFMFPPMKVAEYIQNEHPNVEVSFHATTRSPIMISCDENYPLHSRWSINSVYEAGRITYVYNLSNYDLAIVLSDADVKSTVGIEKLEEALAGAGCKEIIFVHA